MKEVHFPRHDDEWIDSLIVSGASRARQLPIEFLVEAAIPFPAHHAFRLASHVIVRSSVRSSKKSVRKRLKWWLRDQLRRNLDKLLAPQREFNAATVNALTTYIRATERRVLALEAKLETLSKEVSVLKRDKSL
jgi:hypothetical protein